MPDTSNMFWKRLSTEDSALEIEELVMTVPEYMLMSKRLGFCLLEDHDLQNLMRLDMNREVRTFFPGGVSTPEQLREKIIRSHTSFLEKGFGEFSISDLKTNESWGGQVLQNSIMEKSK